MAKKSRHKILNQELRLYRIHCECVRRNPEYRKEHEEFRRNRNEPEFLKELAKQELAARWGCLSGDIPDPEKRPSLEEALSEAVTSEWEFARYMMWRNADPRHHQAINAFLTTFVDRKVAAQEVRGMLFLMYFPEENCEHPSYTVFNMGWSKKDLMENWEHFVDSRLLERSKAPLKQQVPQKRLHLDQYVRYLEAYDLRKMNHTYKQIDLKISPNLGGDEKRGFTYYRKGKALVANPPLLPPLGKRKGGTA